MNLKSLAKTIVQMPGYFMAFQIYDWWLAEEMKNYALFGVVDGGAGDRHSEMLRDGLLFLEA